jgi:hypothetical protein
VVVNQQGISIFWIQGRTGQDRGIDRGPEQAFVQWHLPGCIGWRLEVVRVKDVKPASFWASHAQDEGNMKSGTLEVRNTDCMCPGLEHYRAHLFDHSGQESCTESAALSSAAKRCSESARRSEGMTSISTTRKVSTFWQGDFR